MNDDLETAAQYRHRAEDLRDRAGDESNSAIRSHLLSIAETYERLAAALDDTDIA